MVLTTAGGRPGAEQALLPQVMATCPGLARDKPKQTHPGDQHLVLPSPPKHPCHLLDPPLFNKKPLSSPAFLCTLFLARAFLTTPHPLPGVPNGSGQRGQLLCLPVSRPFSPFWTYLQPACFPGKLDGAFDQGVGVGARSGAGALGHHGLGSATAHGQTSSANAKGLLSAVTHVNQAQRSTTITAAPPGARSLGAVRRSG